MACQNEKRVEFWASVGRRRDMNRSRWMMKSCYAAVWPALPANNGSFWWISPPNATHSATQKQKGLTAEAISPFFTGRGEKNRIPDITGIWSTRLKLRSWAKKFPRFSHVILGHSQKENTITLYKTSSPKAYLIEALSHWNIKVLYCWMLWVTPIVTPTKL